MAKRHWKPIEIDAELDLRLQNWGAWERRQDRAAPQCSPMFRWAKSNVEATEEQSRERSAPFSPKWARIDEADASIISRTIRAQWFPAKEGGFLWAHYVAQAAPALTLRALALKRGDYRVWLARAHVVVKNRLTVVESRVYPSRHNSSAASSLRPVSDPGGERVGEAGQPQALAA